MHPEAKARLGKTILGTLKNISLGPNGLQLNAVASSIVKIGELVAPNSDDYLSEDDAINLFAELIHTRLIPLCASLQTEAPLQNVIGESVLKELSDSLTDHLGGIPYPVCGFLTLPGLRVDRRFSIDEPGFFTVTSGEPLSQEEDSHRHAETGRFELRIETKTRGVSSWLNDTSTNSALASNLKILFYIALEERALSISALSHSISAETHKTRKYQVGLQEKSKWDRSRNFQLPLGFCVFLDKLAIPGGRLNIDSLSNCVRMAASLIKDNKPDTARIRSAIEWGFDARTTEEPAISFLKTCIGLEAILGDNNLNGSLTETLSDRCAYLVATDLMERRNIKERFKSIYKLRSKIVHGVVTRFGSDEHKALKEANLLLKRAIAAELSMLPKTPTFHPAQHNG